MGTHGVRWMWENAVVGGGERENEQGGGIDTQKPNIERAGSILV